MFDSISTIEALVGKELIASNGEMFHPIVEGKWIFDIPLDYERVTLQGVSNQHVESAGIKASIHYPCVTRYELRLNISSGNTERVTLGAL